MHSGKSEKCSETMELRCQNIEDGRSKCQMYGKILYYDCSGGFLYGADSWVVTQRDLAKLRSFHNRALRYITGRHIRKRSEISWEYPNHTVLLNGMQTVPY